MKINIPVSIIRNDNGYALDYHSFILYIKLLELREVNKSDSILVNTKYLKDNMLIDDNRTLKKSFKNLYKNKLINNQIEKLKIKGDNLIDLNIINNEKLMEFELNNMNLLGDIGTIGIRILCYLLSYEIDKEDFYNYSSVKNSDTIAKRMMLARDTIIRYSKLIKQTKFKYLFENDTDGGLYYPSNYKIPEKKKKNIKGKEKDLERHLIKNLNIIEEGMTLIKNQYPVTDGIIDILARDKNNNLCIIELKVVSDDERVVFQSVYYPTQFKEKVRMITIAPDYDNKIKTALSVLNVEMKKYEYKSDKLIIN